MINIKECPLGALEKQSSALFHQRMDQHRGFGDKRLDALKIPEIFLLDRNRIEALIRGLIEVGQQRVFFGNDFLQSGQQRFRMPQVPHPDSPSSNFVFVGRADSASGGADFFLSLILFAKLVDQPMPGHDQVAAGTDMKLALDFDPVFSKFFDFLEEFRQIDDYPVTEDRHRVP